jgi:hypothetical protein
VKLRSCRDRVAYAVQRAWEGTARGGGGHDATVADDLSLRDTSWRRCGQASMIMWSMRRHGA